LDIPNHPSVHGAGGRFLPVVFRNLKLIFVDKFR
jgi:hypothetical protein